MDFIIAIIVIIIIIIYWANRWKNISFSWSKGPIGMAGSQ